MVKHSIDIKDENALVFSLNNNKIYNILIPEKAIGFHNDYPIIIGKTRCVDGFYFQNKMIYDGGLLKGSKKVYDFSKNYKLTKGDDEFKELEIFEVN